MSDILWQPTAERIASTQLAAWQQWLASDQGLVFDSYADLHQWSVTHREEFWKSIWNYFNNYPKK